MANKDILVLQWRRMQFDSRVPASAGARVYIYRGSRKAR